MAGFGSFPEIVVETPRGSRNRYELADRERNLGELTAKTIPR
jgi:hypothetical protein